MKKKILSAILFSLLFAVSCDNTDTQKMEGSDILSSSIEGLTEEEQFEQLLGDKEFYFGNLHAHSEESDGEGSAKEGFQWARDIMDVDFYAVTDHAISMTLQIFDDNYEDIKDAADDYNNPGSFVALAGFEWSSEIYGHMNCWFTSSYTDSYFGTLSRSNWYDWIDSHNGQGQFNHPGREDDFTSILSEEYMWRNFKYSSTGDSNINCCETTNKSTGNNDLIYYALFLRGLGRGWHYAPTANWDNHDITDYRHHRTVMLADSLSRTGLRETIEARRLYATDDNDCQIIFKYCADPTDPWSTASNYWMGSIVNRPASDTAQLSIAVKDPGETIKKVQVVTSFILNPDDEGKDQKAIEVLLAEYTPEEHTDLLTWYPEIALTSTVNGETKEVSYCLVKVISGNTQEPDDTGVLDQDPATLTDDIFDTLIYIEGLSSTDQMAVSAPIWFE